MESTRIDYRGAFREAIVPDTLDLAARAEIALNGIGGTIDPAIDWQMYFSATLACATPYMRHHAADTTCDPKFGESFPLMRLMCGSDLHRETEECQRTALLGRVRDGLYWNLVDPRRPWRSAYNAAFDGERRDEDTANVGANGRMLRALVTWRELSGDPGWDDCIRPMVAALRKIAVDRGDYAYFPDGGFGEPFSYPRSGWKRTDEAAGETEGGEGSVVAYQGHEIQGLARWAALSGDGAALDFAGKIARYCMHPKFWGGLPDPERKVDGSVGHVASAAPDPYCVDGSGQGHWFSHFHARAIALRGILEYAMTAGDLAMIEFVRRSYEYTLQFGIPRMGWINTYPAAVNQMEGCALGDLVALGVRLTDAGAGDWWDDVDALVRNHLVEGQLVRADLLVRIAAASPARDPAETAFPGQETADDVIRRALGSFAGNTHPTGIVRPWVMHCCTGNATQGLYYAWEGALREHAGSARASTARGDAQVNLLLNRAGRLVDVESFLPYEGRVVVRNRGAGRVSIRIPWWVDRRRLRVEVDGVPRAPEWTGNYLVAGDLRPGNAVTVEFPVRESTAAYTVDSRTADEREHACTFRGSTLVDISPRDESPTTYPLYDRASMRRPVAPLVTVRRYSPERIVEKW